MSSAPLFSLLRPCSVGCGSCAPCMPEFRTIDVEEDGIRLDRWFKRHYPHFNQVMLQKLLRKGEVRLDGKRAEASTRVVTGQKVRLPPQVIHAKLEPRERPS